MIVLNKSDEFEKSCEDFLAELLQYKLKECNDNNCDCVFCLLKNTNKTEIKYSLDKETEHKLCQAGFVKQEESNSNYERLSNSTVDLINTGVSTSMNPSLSKNFLVSSATLFLSNNFC